ncbi:MAG: adenosylcobinamide-GDP ribazoletransferase [Pseudomonadota bacterium]
MRALRDVAIAVQFLTLLPIRFKAPPGEEAVGRSLIHYPLVGLMIGALLSGLAWLGSGLSTLVLAALLLGLWVAVTGALHLDGLADSADALAGGLGSREKKLAIMQDPHCGPVAVVTLIVLLLIKFAALEAVLTAGQWQSLILAPLVGRMAAVLLFLTTPYVRPGGLGAALASRLPRKGCVLSLSLFTVAVLAFGSLPGLWLLLAAGLACFALRHAMLKSLGGATGDTAGATIEVTEAVGLVALAFL